MGAARTAVVEFIFMVYLIILSNCKEYTVSKMTMIMNGTLGRPILRCYPRICLKGLPNITDNHRTVGLQHEIQTLYLPDMKQGCQPVHSEV
jgi:hypothetical protein